jgi:hypothetical protein
VALDQAITAWLACILPEFGEWYYQARMAGTPEHLN